MWDSMYCLENPNEISIMNRHSVTDARIFRIKVEKCTKNCRSDEEIKSFLN